MNQLTEKQKKYVWIVAGVLLFIHFFLPRITSLFHIGAGRPAIANPSPIRVPTPSPAPPPSPEVVAATKYGGVWQGDTLMPDANRCAVRLEIRLSDDAPKTLKGYVSKKCRPLQTLGRGPLTRGAVNEMVRETATPASAVMTGTAQPDGINFTVDQTISASSDGCSLSRFSVIDFGQGQLMAEWQQEPSTTCSPGKMLLKKAQR
jgi:hypothetical protein